MRCPNCRRDTAPKYRPFCSRRCADVDLARWMSGGYSIPSQHEEDHEDQGEVGPTTH